MTPSGLPKAHVAKAHVAASRQSEVKVVHGDGSGWSVGHSGGGKALRIPSGLARLGRPCVESDAPEMVPQGALGMSRWIQFLVVIHHLVRFLPLSFLEFHMDMPS